MDNIFFAFIYEIYWPNVVNETNDSPPALGLVCGLRNPHRNENSFLQSYPGHCIAVMSLN
jgi:hypothetical protein